MSDRTTNPRQHDPSLCPSWCAGEHLHTASETTSSAFHHDGEQWSLLPAVQGLEGVDRYVYVTPSQFVPSAESAEAQPALVDLTVDGGLATLTPLEAIQVARALLAAVEQVIV